MLITALSHSGIHTCRSRPYTPQNILVSLATILVSCRINYCNSLLSRIAEEFAQTDKSHWENHRFDHIRPI